MSKPTIISDRNVKSFLADLRTTNVVTGLIERDFDAFPQGCYEGVRAFDLPLIPEVEWEERLAERKANKATQTYLRMTGNGGKEMPTLYQNGQGYCWTYSTYHVAQLLFARMGVPYVHLSAHAGACLVKNYRDEGGWCQQSLEQARKGGFWSKEFWPLQNMKRSNDTPAGRADAAKRIVTEWLDFNPNGQNKNREEMKRQVVTMLLLGLPLMGDFNWWGHSVCIEDIVSLKPFRLQIWNSHEGNEHPILEEGKAIPNNAAAPLVAGAAA